MVNYVSILGSTGSIGRQSLDIISRLPQVRVAALTAGSSVERMVNYVSILGSTGSIGRQSLDIISRLPQVRVAALTAGSSVERMAQQCR